jgi:hypothetical protein
MLRTAFAPFVRRSGFTASTYCIGGSVVIGTFVCNKSSLPNFQFQRFTECSSTPNVFVGDFSLASSSIATVSDEIIQSISLIVPTLGALLRASRLIATAGTMAADYQLSSVQRRYPTSIITWIYKILAPKSNDNGTVNEEHESRRLQLENAVAQLEKDLERAQHEYVNSDGDSNRHQSLSERTLSKRAQKETMLSIANDLADAQEALSYLHENGGTNNVHKRNALRLLELCRTNGGVYVKVGQHLANLDLLLPEEYIHTLSSLFDDAPRTTYSDVCRVVKEELGCSPDELFEDFSKEPFASASLAQVHTAKCKTNGKKLAIKVQHLGLRETSRGDLLAMSSVVRLADKLFEEFKFGWICEELTPQLPKELNFVNEGKNAEAAASHLKKSGLDCVVPSVLWDLTSQRVLTMEFEEGFKATDVNQIDQVGLKRRDVAQLISSVFNAQIFQNGFVHCDPHEANGDLIPGTFLSIL